MTQEILAELSEHFHTEDAADILLRELRRRGDVADQPVLGKGKAPGKRSAADIIRQSYRGTASAPDSLEATSATLDRLYGDNRRRADVTLYAGIVAACLCVATVIWVVYIAVVSGAKSNLIRYAASVFPALLSATLFYLHRFQQVRLDAIQNDIRMLDVARRLLELREGMHDENRKKAEETAIKIIQKFK